MTATPPSTSIGSRAARVSRVSASARCSTRSWAFSWRADQRSPRAAAERDRRRGSVDDAVANGAFDVATLVCDADLVGRPERLERLPRVDLVLEGQAVHGRDHVARLQVDRLPEIRG